MEVYMKKIKDTILAVIVNILFVIISPLLVISMTAAALATLVDKFISIVTLYIKYPNPEDRKRELEKIKTERDKQLGLAKKRADINKMQSTLFISITIMQNLMKIWLVQYYNKDYIGQKMPLPEMEKLFNENKSDALHQIYALRFRGYELSDEWVKTLENLNYNSFTNPDEITALYPKYNPDFGKPKNE